jgi:hypothetical protein
MEFKLGINICTLMLVFGLSILAESENPVSLEAGESILAKRSARIDFQKTNDYLNGKLRGKGKSAKGTSGKGITKIGTGRGAAPASAQVPYMDFKENINDPVPPDPEGASGGPPSRPPSASIPPCPTDAPQGPTIPYNEIGDSGIARIQTQDRFLQVLAHKVAVFGIPAEFSQEPNNSFILYRQTVDVFKHYCPSKVIPDSFIDNVAQTFELLHNYLTPARTPYTTDEETKWVTHFLNICSNASSESKLFYLGEECSDEILADPDRKPICEPGMEKTKPDSFDPMIDIVWRIFELAHTVCFDHFKGFSRIWHRYAAAIEDLFTLPIKQRWSNPVSDEKFFLRLLGPNYRTYSANIGKCVQYYAQKSKIGVRLHRFNQPFTVRYGQNISVIFETDPRPTRPPRPTVKPPGPP